MLNYFKSKLIRILILSGIITTLFFSGMTDAQAVSPITARGVSSYSYWMANMQIWPLNAIEIGDITYNRGDALKIMGLVEETDRSYRLAAELIAAKLNVAAGNDASCISSLIEHADRWLADNPAGSGVTVLDIPWKMEGMNLYAILGEYNDGFLCAPSRDEQVAPLPTQALIPLYGVIQGFPENFLGEWMISDLQIMANENTSIQAIKTSFDVETMVKVLFYIDDDGVRYAAKIMAHYRNDKKGQDDDRNGSYEGSEGHAFGIVSERPEPVGNLFGNWVVGGIDYQVTEKTRFSGYPFEEKLEVDTTVQVRYYVDETGNRIAKQIMPASNRGQTRTPGHHIIAGFLNKLADLIDNSLSINNVDFDPAEDMEVDESLGILARNTYITAEYTAENGKRRLHRLKTHVPPGAGENTTQGIIEGMDSDIVAMSEERAAVDINQEIWTIDGIEYLVDVATDLSDMTDGILERGELVTINSYTDADGREVATQIRSVSVIDSEQPDTDREDAGDGAIDVNKHPSVYLPIIIR